VRQILHFTTAARGASNNYLSAVDDIVVVESPNLTGDFNDDGRVDAADYVRWRTNTSNSALPNDNGLATQAERYDLWRANFGNTEGSGSAAAASNVPEPAAGSTFLIAIALTLTHLRRRWRAQSATCNEQI
jgi:hypothetical protein